MDCATDEQCGACQVFFAAAIALGASALVLAVRQLLLWRLVRPPALILASKTVAGTVSGHFRLGRCVKVLVRGIIGGVA